MNPATTALLLIGFQNDQFSANAPLRSAIDDAERTDSVLESTLRFVSQVSELPMTVIVPPTELTQRFVSATNANGILWKLRESGALLPGTPGAEPIPELQAYGDRILTVRGKSGFNAFLNTSIERELRDRNITDVVIAGAITSLCVDSTARTAYELGYNVTMLTDCVLSGTAAEHDLYCERMFPLYARAVDSRTLLGELESAAA